MSLTGEGHGRPAPGIPGRPSGGWLSPDGRLRACHDEDCAATAEDILREEIRGGPGESPAETLRREGWCRVLDEGDVVPGDAALTDAQRSALVALARGQRRRSPGWRLMRCRDLLVDAVGALPQPSGNARG
jgi:hypothetical protein